MDINALCDRVDTQRQAPFAPSAPLKDARELGRSLGHASTPTVMWVYAALEGNVVCWRVGQKVGRAMGCGSLARFVRPYGFVPAHK